MKIDGSLITASMADRTETKSQGQTDREILKKACQDFESIFLAQTWKKMMSDARRLGGKKDEDRHFGAMEDLATEMSAESLAGQDSNGLWRVLYDSLVTSLPAEGDVEKDAQ